MPNPSEDMVSHINGLVPSLVGGTNMFASRVRAPRGDVPVDAVFVFAGPGRRPERTMGHDDEIRRPVVTIHARNGRQKAGSDLIQSIFSALLGTVPTGYLDMYTSMSSPTDSGFDSDGRHNFSVTYVLTYLGT